jgi:hypothetical protein
MRRSHLDVRDIEIGVNKFHVELGEAASDVRLTSGEGEYDIR